MNHQELSITARTILAAGKGLLAADESTRTITKRLAAVGVESSEEVRRSYRQLLLTTVGLNTCISGIILYDETIKQRTSDGTLFPQYLAGIGILPGIKVDLGAKPLAGCPGETVTEGLDGLRERLAQYAALGAKFAKWRAVITIADGIPTDYAIETNAAALARYAALCQEASLVPIVEPEVMMSGDHSIKCCEATTGKVLERVFEHLNAARVFLEGMILKPNMVMAGNECRQQASPVQVSAATIRVLMKHVPAAVPGVAFLSGGQSPLEATTHLNLVHAAGPLPWTATFSYARALQDDVLHAWVGQTANAAKGQAALLKRAQLNGLASTGAYRQSMETRES